LEAALVQAELAEERRERAEREKEYFAELADEIAERSKMSEEKIEVAPRCFRGGFFGMIRAFSRPALLHVEPQWKRTGVRRICFQRKSPGSFEAGIVRGHISSKSRTDPVNCLRRKGRC
jgi:hypothetical protein